MRVPVQYYFRRNDTYRAVFFLNPHSRDALASQDHDAPFDRSAAARASLLLSQCFDHRSTPLVSLRGTARELGLGEVVIKDESARLGLNSFKALGGAYAVIGLVLDEASRRLGRPVAAAELPRPASGSLALPADGALDGPGNADVAAIAAEFTFACATAGNHGQSVAAGARLVGARTVIFVPQGLSAQRRQAIARFGADVRTVPGGYDDAVAEAGLQAERHGWTLLSDTSWPGYTDIPMRVMQGYTAMSDELGRQLDAPFTHVFLQAGVGGMAAAMAASLGSVFAPTLPCIVVVEPSRAACLLASALAGKRVAIGRGWPTVMARLECYEPSLVAWDILKTRATAFMTVDDEDAIEAVRRLARPREGERAIMAGESGGAGLAGLLVACREAPIRESLGLGPTSRVLLINTEGALDAENNAAHADERP